MDEKSILDSINIFSQKITLLLTLFTVSLVIQKSLILMQPNSAIFPFIVCAFLSLV